MELDPEVVEFIYRRKRVKQIIEAVGGLSDKDRSRFLAGLIGVVAIDSPKTIIDCAGWSEIEGLKAFRYPPPDIDDETKN